jgi:hypothetical protein
MKKIIIIALIFIGCSNNSPTTSNNGAEDNTRHFTFDPYNNENERYLCHPDEADQFCILNGYARAIFLDDCFTEPYSGIPYLTGVTCSR